MSPPTKRFGYHDDVAPIPPNFDRTVQALSDADLEEEILGKRGGPDYQLALLAEADRRSKGDQ